MSTEPPCIGGQLTEAALLELRREAFEEGFRSGASRYSGYAFIFDETDRESCRIDFEDYLSQWSAK